MTGGNCIACKIVGLLVVIGALNWGAVAAFETDLVAALLGDAETPARIVYGLVGIAGVISLLCLFGVKCPCCKGSCAK